MKYSSTHISIVRSLHALSADNAQLAAYNRAAHRKPIGAQVIQKFSAFDGSRVFDTKFSVVHSAKCCGITLD
jgi:hypothetical protein